MPEEVARTDSVWNGCSGSLRSRGTSSTSAWATSFSLSPRHAALVHDAIDPSIELAIQIGKRAIGASREEGLSNVANTTLGPPLFIAARDGDGLGREVVVPGELEDAL